MNFSMLKSVKTPKYVMLLGWPFPYFVEFGKQADVIFATVADLYAAQHDLSRSLASYQQRQQVFCLVDTLPPLTCMILESSAFFSFRC